MLRCNERSNDGWPDTFGRRRQIYLYIFIWLSIDIDWADEMARSNRMSYIYLWLYFDWNNCQSHWRGVFIWARGRTCLVSFMADALLNGQRNGRCSTLRLMEQQQRNDARINQWLEMLSDILMLVSCVVVSLDVMWMRYEVDERHLSMWYWWLINITYSSMMRFADDKGIVAIFAFGMLMISNDQESCERIIIVIKHVRFGTNNSPLGALPFR